MLEIKLRAFEMQPVVDEGRPLSPIFSFSYSLRQQLCQIMGRRPLKNPGSATDIGTVKGLTIG